MRWRRDSRCRAVPQLVEGSGSVRTRQSGSSSTTPGLAASELIALPESEKEAAQTASNLATALPSDANRALADDVSAGLNDLKSFPRRKAYAGGVVRKSDLAELGFEGPPAPYDGGQGVSSNDRSRSRRWGVQCQHGWSPVGRLRAAFKRYPACRRGTDRSTALEDLMRKSETFDVDEPSASRCGSRLIVLHASARRRSSQGSMKRSAQFSPSLGCAQIHSWESPGAPEWFLASELDSADSPKAQGAD